MNGYDHMNTHTMPCECCGRGIGLDVIWSEFRRAAAFVRGNKTQEG